MVQIRLSKKDCKGSGVLLGQGSIGEIDEMEIIRKSRFYLSLSPIVGLRFADTIPSR